MALDHDVNNYLIKCPTLNQLLYCMELLIVHGNELCLFGKDIPPDLTFFVEQLT